MGTPNKATLEVTAFCRAELSNHQYVESLRGRLRSGKLHPSLEALMWHYAFGKPKEQHELTGRVDLSSLSDEELGVLRKMALRAAQ